MVALLFAKVVSAKAGGVCGITTHPPAPSQREGGTFSRAIYFLKIRNR